MVDKRLAYLELFYSLDLLYDQEPSDELAAFLSDADPFVWEDGESGDPAVWDEFSRMFDQHFPDGGAGETDTYLLAVEFLEDVAPALAASFGASVDRTLWSERLRELEQSKDQ